jgi:hypothetical protein
MGGKRMIVASEELVKQLSNESIDFESDNYIGAYSGFTIIPSTVYPFQCDDGTIVNGVMRVNDSFVLLVDTSKKILPFTTA